MSSSRLDGETTPTTVRRSSAERGRSPSEGDRKHPRRDGHRPECAAYGLITPHGDRKPVCARSRRATRGPAHYPSWGSETRTYRSWSTGASLPISLPLMGIGNAKVGSAFVAATPLLSLPLMGIGNLPKPDHVARVTLLITPHGDRKPEQLGRLLLARRELITPHGDRKLFVARQLLPRIWYSLPLMGIGKRPPQR